MWWHKKREDDFEPDQQIPVRTGEAEQIAESPIRGRIIDKTLVAGRWVYSWTLTIPQADGTHLDVSPAMGGTLTYYPAYELNNNGSISTDGSVVVDLMPTGGTSFVFLSGDGHSWVQISSTTKIAGRYRGYRWTENAATRTWTQQEEIWIDPPNSGTLTASTKYLAHYLDTISSPTGTLTVSGSPTGGTFTITVDGSTSGVMAFNETAAHVQAAIRLLTGQSTATGSAGGPWAIVWTTGPGDVTTDASGLTGGTPVVTYAAGPGAVFQTETEQGITVSDSGGGSFSNITNIRVADAFVSNPSTGLGLFTISAVTTNGRGVVDSNDQVMGAGHKTFTSSVYVGAAATAGNPAGGAPYAELGLAMLRLYPGFSATQYGSFEADNTVAKMIARNSATIIATAYVSNSATNNRFVLDSQGKASPASYCIADDIAGIGIGAYSDGTTTGGLTFMGGIWTGGTLSSSGPLVPGTTVVTGGTTGGILYGDGTKLQSSPNFVIDGSGNPNIKVGTNYASFGEASF